MPTFVDLRKWVQAEAAAHGMRCSNRKAKHLAGKYLLAIQLEEDGVADSTITYADETGEEACRRWTAHQLGLIAA